MARRNLFQPPPPPGSPSGSLPGTPAGAPPESPAVAAEDSKPRFPNTGAMSGVRSTLKDLSSNAVREIAPEMIEDDGPRDRLTITDADVAALTESLRAHGQQVPIMVRPIAERPGHYRIVYGRRRLQALRVLGRPAKALVRSLSDQEAILAQGQENAERLDPSFIEKALFAAELAQVGYEASVIQDALAIDKAMLSRMNKVARSIPSEVIQSVGPAHGIGRRRWEDLADSIRQHELDLVAIAAAARLDTAPTSDARFAQLSAAVASHLRQSATAPATPPALPVTLADGTLVGEITETARALTLKLPKSAGPGFTDWLRDNADAALQRLHDDWRAGRKAQ